MQCHARCSEDVTPWSRETTFACPVAKHLSLYPSYDVFTNAVYMTDENLYVQILPSNRYHKILEVAMHSAQYLIIEQWLKGINKRNIFDIVQNLNKAFIVVQG